MSDEWFQTFRKSLRFFETTVDFLTIRQAVISQTDRQTDPAVEKLKCREVTGYWRGKHNAEFHEFSPHKLFG